MNPSTYRLTVVGTVLSSFLTGMHIPALHGILEHGESPRWSVLMATLLLAVAALGCTWTLLKRAQYGELRSQR